MKYLEAVDLARQIKSERPDVLVRISHYAGDAELVVKKMAHKRPGWSPTGLGRPCHVRDPEDWIRVRSTL